MILQYSMLKHQDLMNSQCSNILNALNFEQCPLNIAAGGEL